MKVLSFSKLAFVCALVLGLFVAYCVAMPKEIGAENKFGGYQDGDYLAKGCGCTKNATTSVRCNKVPHQPSGCQDLFNGCRIVGGGTAGTCKDDGPTRCNGGGCGVAQPEQSCK